MDTGKTRPHYALVRLELELEFYETLTSSLTCHPSSSTRQGNHGLWPISLLSKDSRETRPKSRPPHATIITFVVDIFHTHRRGYRLGIDTSIWLHHVVFAKGGSNPEIRALFCRLCTLCESVSKTLCVCVAHLRVIYASSTLTGCLPIIPLFVFDGQQRPTDKVCIHRPCTGDDEYLCD